MIDKQQFREKLSAAKESEWLIPFEELGLEPQPYAEVEDFGDRKDAILAKQAEIVTWCEEIPGCNWSVGFVDNEEQNVLVVKWWFKEQDYPVAWSEE